MTEEEREVVLQRAEHQRACASVLYSEPVRAEEALYIARRGPPGSAYARTQAGDVTSVLQPFIPGLTGQLKAAWFALGVWQRHEEPERALPLTDDLADALAGQAVKKRATSS